MVRRRAAFLAAYQNAAYARRYADRIAALRAPRPGPSRLHGVTEAAAKNLFKLMAAKDEYEVARLYTDGSFARGLARQFESYDRWSSTSRRRSSGAATPTAGRENPARAWMMKGFRLLAALKGLRGTAFDISAAPRAARRARLSGAVRSRPRPDPGSAGAGPRRGGGGARLGAGAGARLRPCAAGVDAEGGGRARAAGRAAGFRGRRTGVGGRGIADTTCLPEARFSGPEAGLSGRKGPKNRCSKPFLRRPWHDQA